VAHLLQVEAVGDVVCSEEGGHQVGDGSSLATVRPELEGVHSPFPGDQGESSLTMFYMCITCADKPVIYFSYRKIQIKQIKLN